MMVQSTSEEPNADLDYQPQLQQKRQYQPVT